MANISNMTKNQNIPALLRATRSALNYTQEQLAERLGVAVATINRWEGGGNAPQRAAREAILALAQEAGVGSGESGPAPAEAAAEVTRRRTRRASATPTTKPMEQMLWDAACSIRGEKDAAKFKDYLLPLLFLKRLSDVFDDEIDRLAEEYGDRATALEIAESDHSLLRFYLPPEARWGAISGREACHWPLDNRGRPTAPRDIGEHLTKAVRAVVRQNPMLAGVIDVVDFAASRNGERDINPSKLQGVVETFSDPRYRLGLADVQPDFLGRAYEYLLRKFAEGSGQSAGEFFTPTEVGLLIAHLMRPRPGETCHDYACGSGGLLIKLQIVARELDPTSRVPVRLSGQELQADNYAIAQMNAIIHDMDVELARGDTMINPKFREASGKIRGHDIVVANPMWNQPFSPELLANDPFDRFRTTGGITSGKGDWAWLQHTLACLSEHGRAAVVLDTGAVTRGSGSKNEDKERNVRKWFVDHDLIDGVILLPENLFYNTTAAGVVVVLNKRKPAARKGRIVLLNASRRFRKGRPKNFLPEEEIRALAGMYLKGEPVEGEVAVITKQQAEEADYNLSPSRWAGQGGSALTGSVSGLLKRLADLDGQSHRLSTAIAKLLTSIEDEPPGAIFTHGLRGAAQKESEIGPIPETWTLTAFRDIRERLQYGTSTHCSAVPGNHPVLRIPNVEAGRVDPSELKYCNLPATEAEKYLLQKGDLLFIRTNGVLERLGSCAVYQDEPEDALFASYLIRARLKTKIVDPRYVAYFYASSLGTSLVANRATPAADGKFNLNTATIDALPIPLPPTLEEQREIVAVLDSIDRKIDLHRRKRAVLDELFKSLLHKLMTGEIRVDQLDLTALESAQSTEGSPT